MSMIGNSIKELADAMDGIETVISEFANAYRRTFQSAVSTLFPLKTGCIAIVDHPETGRFSGHVAEQMTDKTVTVARESDGVLVHLPRDAIVSTRPRE